MARKIVVLDCCHIKGPLKVMIPGHVVRCSKPKPKPKKACCTKQQFMTISISGFTGQPCQSFNGVWTLELDAFGIQGWSFQNVVVWFEMTCTNGVITLQCWAWMGVHGWVWQATYQGKTTGCSSFNLKLVSSACSNPPSNIAGAGSPQQPNILNASNAHPINSGILN